MSDDTTISNETQELIAAYTQDPIGNHSMDWYDITWKEWNPLCDDNIEIFLKIEDDAIVACSYLGSLSMVGLTASSMIAEKIVWSSFDEILNRDYTTIAQMGLMVSSKRKRAATLPILAIRNAIHNHLGHDHRDEFDSLIDDY